MRSRLIITFLIVVQLIVFGAESQSPYFIYVFPSRLIGRLYLDSFLVCLFFGFCIDFSPSFLDCNLGNL